VVGRATAVSSPTPSPAARDQLSFVRHLGIVVSRGVGFQFPHELRSGHLLAERSLRRLWVGILLNLLFLSFFKYLPLAARHSDRSTLAGLGRLVLPIGISFWTFEALSYLLDLYAEEDLRPTLLEFCLYVAFWPTALSGPICRLPKMLSQFREYWIPCWSDLAIGTQRIAVGLIMMWLSQILAAGLYPNTGVDYAFSLPVASIRGIDVWIMIVGYGFQLFFNFCGYSHLVIGAARCFGFRLAENFNRPYLSTTTSEFWTRWHMSLSFWIRDYVFIPLATMRVELWWRNLSLVIAMGTHHPGDTQGGHILGSIVLDPLVTVHDSPVGGVSIVTS
jgi:alginate O-acetyltransferase complex protein AlgI